MRYPIFNSLRIVHNYAQTLYLRLFCTKMYALNCVACLFATTSNIGAIQLANKYFQYVASIMYAYILHIRLGLCWVGAKEEGHLNWLTALVPHMHNSVVIEGQL